jgi:hydrocephalus-inducing protein
MYTDFGAVSVNADVKKVIPLINRSAKAVKFKVEPSNKEKFAKCFLSITPDDKQEITLKPKETLPLEIKFKPKTRLGNFDHDILLSIEGMDEKKKVLSLLGAAHGIELKLMDEQVAFGSVVKDSRLTKSLQMSNFGDVKASFTWDKKAFGEHFTISPVSGFINPNSNVDLEVTFHPKIVDNALSTKVTCAVQGGDPLSVVLLGKSVKQEGQELKMDFKSVVRKQTVQNITIQNPEDKEWVINPTISTKDDTSKGYF